MARPRGFNQYMEFERGFHGWLTFFFVTSCLGVLLRAYALFEAIRVARLVLGHVDDIGVVAASQGQMAIEFALLVAAVYGLRLFLREDRRTPTFWAVFFLISIPATLAVDACTAFQTAYFDRTDFAAAFRSLLATGGLRGMAMSLMWALYWMRSDPVLRLTYGATAFALRQDPTIGRPRHDNQRAMSGHDVTASTRIARMRRICAETSHPQLA